jgi:cyclase
MRGSRTVRLLHFGPAHTTGDLVVFLPREHLVITGDLVHTNLASLFLGDAYFPGWPDALDSLKALDFEMVVPSHQSPFRGHERIDQLQSYFRDLWMQAAQLHSRGVRAEDAARTVDLRAHAPNIAGAGAVGADPVAIRRLWELLDGKR